MSAVIFRADASTFIGTGHIMRCLTLAIALREKTSRILFICREHRGHLCDLLEQHGFAVERLPASGKPALPTESPGHAEWLDATWQNDADQTQLVIERFGFEVGWLIVDHYALDQKWETRLRAATRNIMVIDDLADREHDCDLLLDQNLVASMEHRYIDKAPDSCKLLLGPKYALLQSAYADMHSRSRPRIGPVRRLLVFFGGVDNANLTGIALSAFLSLSKQSVHVDVVVAPTNPHLQSIALQVTGHSNIHVHTSQPTLASLIASADLAIGACGATTWERLCLGLPSLVVTVAENQVPIATELNHRGLIRWLGHCDEVDESIIASALSPLISLGLDEQWSKNCLAVVDGYGTRRICAAITANASTALHVRQAEPGDEIMLLELANDPVTRRNGFNTAPISAATHSKWLFDRLSDVDKCRFYIVETADGVPLGQVRFEHAAQTWQVNYSIAPAYRGRGLGAPVLAAAISKLQNNNDAGTVLGRVKNSNTRSRKIFESLGFDAEPGAADVTVYRRRL